MVAGRAERPDVVEVKLAWADGPLAQVAAEPGRDVGAVAQLRGQVFASDVAAGAMEAVRELAHLPGLRPRSELRGSWERGRYGAMLPGRPRSMIS